MRPSARFAVRRKTRPFAFVEAQPLVMIVGAATFLGRAISQVLSEERFNLLLVDREFPKDACSNFRFAPNVHLLQHTLSSPWPPAIPFPKTIFFFFEDLPEDSFDFRHLPTIALRLVELSVRAHARLVVATSAFLPEHETERNTAVGMMQGIGEQLFLCALMESSRQYDANTAIVSLSDLYGPGVPGDRRFPIHHMIVQARKGTVTLSGDGLYLLYPLHISDAMTGLMAAAFDSSAQKGQYTLFPTTPISALKLGSMIQRATVPNRIRLVFTDDVPSGRRHVLPTSQLKWRPTASLEETLRRLLQKGLPTDIPMPSVHRRNLSVEGAVKRKKHKQNLFRRFSPVFFSLARLSLPFALIVFSFSVGIGVTHLFSTLSRWGFSFPPMNEVLMGSFSSPSRPALAASFATLLQEGFARTPALGQHAEFFSAGADIAEANAEIVRAGSSFRAFLSGLSAPAGTTTRQAMTAAKNALSLADFSLGSAQARLAMLEENLPIGIPSATVVRIRRDTAAVREELLTLQSTMQFLSRLLGVSSKRSYLVLLQDNDVLRPGGGLVRALGRLVVQDGSIVEWSVEPVRALDEQHAHAPPPALSGVLGTTTWSFAETSWWPHFPQTARASLSLFQSVVPGEVDGVIALDRSAIRRLLSITGGVQLSLDPNQMRAEDEQFAAVGRVLLPRLVAALPEEWATMGSTVGDLVLEKHIMMVGNDTLLANILQRRRWDGAWYGWIGEIGEVVFPLSTTLSTTASTPLSPIIDQRIERDITIRDDGMVDEVVTVRLQAEREVKEDLLLSLFLPPTATPEAVLVNGQSKPIVLQPGEYWHTIQTVAGFPPDGSLTFSFPLKHQPIERHQLQRLRILQTKQPGREGDNVDIRLTMPPDVVPTVVRPTADVADYTMRWHVALARDSMVELVFSP